MKYFKYFHYLNNNNIYSNKYLKYLRNYDTELQILKRDSKSFKRFAKF